MSRIDLLWNCCLVDSAREACDCDCHVPRELAVAAVEKKLPILRKVRWVREATVMLQGVLGNKILSLGPCCNLFNFVGGGGSLLTTKVS